VKKKGSPEGYYAETGDEALEFRYGAELEA
jgi:hypothetical protein